MIDYVSLQGNKTKPEFQLKTYLLVVVSHVVSVVMVVSPVELGVTSRKLVLLLVIFMDKNNGVVLIHSLHAIIILMDHMDHVEHLNPHLNVSRVAHLNQNVHTLLIFIMQSTLIPLVTVNLLFRVKSFLLDLLKQPSQCMMISLLTSLVFTNILAEANLVVMLLRFLVGVLKMESNIGYVPILGMKDGETMVSLRYSVEAIIVVLKLK